jgi:predicted RNA-binding protein with TRAM domain
LRTFRNNKYPETVVGVIEASSDPKPVEAGKEYEVDVTEISRKADGI